MNKDQQNKCLALLLAIAFDSDTDKAVIQKAVKKFLGELPPAEVSKAAATPAQF